MASRRPALACLSAWALGCCLWVSPAVAQDADAGTRMAARELAVSGAEAFDQQDFATALDRFQRAESLYKVPSISIMVARCLARTGRLVEAVDKFEETLRVPLDAAAPEAFQRAVAEATTEVDAARARVARLEVRLPADAPAGTVVTLDGKQLPAALLGVPTPVNPGPHVLAAHAPARSPYSLNLVLSEGGRQQVTIALSTMAPPPRSQQASAGSPSRGRTSLLTITLLTGGGVALAVGAVTGVAAMSHKSSLDAACKPGCPRDMSEDLSSFRRDRALSYVGFGLGLAAAGTGTYLLFHEGASGNQVGAVVLPAGAALRGTF